MTRRLIAGEPIRRGDALTVTRTVGREGDCWTFEVGPIGPDNPRDYEAGPLGFALADYEPGDKVGVLQAAGFNVPTASLPGAVPWATPAQAVPLAAFLKLRDQVESDSRG